MFWVTNRAVGQKLNIEVLQIFFGKRIQFLFENINLSPELASRRGFEIREMEAEPSASGLGVPLWQSPDRSAKL